MKKTIAIALTALAMGAAAPAMAGETAAGCGLGKMIMEGKSGAGSNIAAGILNVFPIPNTLFMTTASVTGEPVLGCDPNQTVMNETEKRSFVASNLDSLSQEAAQGYGMHLSALADIVGVAAEDKDTFYSMTQQEYATLFPAEQQDASQVLSSLQTAMAQHPTLAHYTR